MRSSNSIRRETWTAWQRAGEREERRAYGKEERSRGEGRGVDERRGAERRECAREEESRAAREMAGGKNRCGRPAGQIFRICSGDVESESGAARAHWSADLRGMRGDTMRCDATRRDGDARRESSDCNMARATATATATERTATTTSAGSTRK